MKAVVVAPRGGARIREVPEPIGTPSEVLVRPLLVGLCGTDIELIEGTVDPAYVRYPLILGHEWVGALCDDLDGRGRAGTRVVVEGIVPCGHCVACSRGDTNLCATYDEIGFTRPGALAEYVSVPTHLVHALDDRVALEDAVLTEPMAVVWRALSRQPILPGARVAVIGDGTIALLAAHLVGQFHPHSVVMVGRRPEQEDLARRAGVSEFTTEVPSESFDVVVEAAGTSQAVLAALAGAARGATIILLGLPPQGSFTAVDPGDLVNRDLTLTGSFSYTRQAWAEVVRRLNDGSLRPSLVVTHRFALDRVADALSALRGDHGASGPRGKVVIEMGRP